MKLISFKIPDDVASKLESLKSDEDSISLVAKRIVLEALGIASRRTTLEEKIDLILEEIEELKSGQLGKPTVRSEVSQLSQPMPDNELSQGVEYDDIGQLGKLSSNGEPSKPLQNSKPGKPACPHCGSTGNHLNKGVRSEKRRWRCANCKKNFSINLFEGTGSST